MNVLIVYATYSSSTLLAAQAIQEEMVVKNHSVRLAQAGDIAPEDLTAYDLVFLGSPSWYNQHMEGMPHEDFLRLRERMNGMSLAGKRYAIFGLGDRNYSHFCGAVDYLEQCISEHNGTCIGESLRIDSFFTNQQEKLQHIRSWANSILRDVQPV